MIEPETRKALYLFYREGNMGIRELSRRLKISRNTVRDIIRHKGQIPERERADSIRIDPALLEKLYRQCRGFKQRMHEKLVEEEKIPVKYSTLTRKVRELGLGTAADRRCNRVPDKPGAEMQHDTSPYTVELGGRRTKVIASMLYLRYSKRRYLKFYRVFNRFTMKCFFHEVLTFWGYAAAICVIDNTNLARLRGTGAKAVIVSEMVAFSRQYGFTFVCHERGHCNRKAGEERGFWTVETNFFPGRTFASLEDLNQEAFEWAAERMYHRPLTKARIVPAEAFEHERAYLTELPPDIPAPYRVYERSTDQYGFVAFGGNFFWVPGTSRGGVRVLEYSDSLKLYRGRALLAEYALPPSGVRNKDFSPEGKAARGHKRRQRKPTAQEEARLRGLGEVVAAYLDFALKPKGIERHRMVRELFALSRKMTPALFVKSVARALKYGIVSPETIERIAVLYVNEGTEGLIPDVEVDESFRQREAYREGQLTDEPDFSGYEKLCDEDNG